MKRTLEFTLLILGLICSFIYIIFAFILKAGLNAPDAQAQFTKAFEENNQNNSEISADQVFAMLNPASNLVIVILIISIIFAIVAMIFVKRQRILAGVLAIIAGLISILTFNIFSLVFFIVAGIVLFVRKDESKHQFEDVNFQDNNHSADDEIYHQENDFNERHKKKKDDDPYIY
ncbi:DUF4064 domain-containing protein [Mammaliicoccus sp. Dog046]|uniref:DUF4064 domain-containing protein n=1 Tax=Mammaliicoccus sp. Dog046 TaxID=3034233 RepID=UPI002B25A7A8|nr:DUF4064 domain-containing protein [Mammaliicoccus sp. Dog046]WQK84699.1 DUF4064 domain-containing protein [Mammaliicoccus sp. Dog046]